MLSGDVCYDPYGNIVSCEGGADPVCYDDEGQIVPCVPSTGGAAPLLGPVTSDAPTPLTTSQSATVLGVGTLIAAALGAGASYAAVRTGKGAAIGGGIGAAIGLGATAVLVKVAGPDLRDKLYGAGDSPAKA
jgi:hypothetical protein